MFTLDDMRMLLNRRPFVPFRLWLSDGGHIDVPTPEVIMPLRRYSIVGLLDPNAADEACDRYATVWYMHVTRHEALRPGESPFAPPGDSSPGTPSPATGR